MKGLLLKEWYMMKHYCRAYLFITVIFLAIFFFNNENLFFALYPCLLCGMIPVNLLSYDERSGWNRYSGALPYTRAQLVSVKYLIALFSMLAVLLATGVLQIVKMSLNASFRLYDLLILLLTMLILTQINVSVCLPFIFRFGTEKGRIVYYVMLVLFFAGIGLVYGLFTGKMTFSVSFPVLLLGLSLAGCALYALSWMLSIVFYRKREM